jgi:hypothetical protein
MKIKLPNPIKELGEITFKGGPIEIDIYFVDRKAKKAYYTWDFGMDDFMNLDSNFCGIKNIKNIKKIRDKVIRQCEFDLSHAFFHPSEDPNYTCLHWALLGWYKDLVDLKEFE